MPVDAQPDKVKKFIGDLPYGRSLGMTMIKIVPGQVTMALPYRGDLVGDPATGVLHGGAVSALMDTVCGAAVMSRPDAPGATATLDLRIDYMRAAHPGQTVTAEARCTHVARSVAFVHATAWDDDRAHPVATAVGAFTMAGDGKDAP
ncbi:MAG: PaaI family thioesterase [Qingshengfaniella sp.]